MGGVGSKQSLPLRHQCRAVSLRSGQDVTFAIVPFGDVEISVAEEVARVVRCPRHFTRKARDCDTPKAMQVDGEAKRRACSRRDDPVQSFGNQGPALGRGPERVMLARTIETQAVILDVLLNVRTQRGGRACSIA